jgi:hypothetical protein
VSSPLKDPDRHKLPGVLARPEPKVAAAAREELRKAGWSMNDFLVACLALLTRNPAAMLGRLDEFRPTPRRGRPRKTDET